MRGPARCGTPSGYTAHQNRGEDTCDACTRAKAEYDARWRSAPDKTRQNRLRARAQARAMTELRRRYPDEYRALYDHHLLAVYAESPLDE